LAAIDYDAAATECQPCCRAPPRQVASGQPVAEPLDNVGFIESPARERKHHLNEFFGSKGGALVAVGEWVNASDIISISGRQPAKTFNASNRSVSQRASQQ